MRCYNGTALLVIYSTRNTTDEYPPPPKDIKYKYHNSKSFPLPQGGETNIDTFALESSAHKRVYPDKLQLDIIGVKRHPTAILQLLNLQRERLVTKIKHVSIRRLLLTLSRTPPTNERSDLYS